MINIYKGDKMGTIAIFREARKGGGSAKNGKNTTNQVSTLEHILNKQEYNNSNIKHNANKFNENVLIYFDSEKNEFIKQNYFRNNRNQELIEKFKNKENELDKEARADYKEHKTQQKKDNPQKKIRTVLQSKNLKRECLIAFSNDLKVENKKDFEAKILQTAKKIMEKKGLEDRNILSISIHYDEKSPHAHIQYNEYSFIHKTTATEHNKIRKSDNLDSKAITKLNRENFGKFQDLVANEMGMQRGAKDSKALHKEKYEFYQSEVKKNKDINIVFNSQQKAVQAEIARNEAVKEKNEVNELLYDKSKQVNELNEKIETLEKSAKFLELEKDKINNKSTELSELFKILGLESIKEYKNEDIKKVVEKQEFKTMIDNFIDMFKNIMKQLITDKIEERKKIDFSKFISKNQEQQELTNNVNNKNISNKNNKNYDIDI